MMESLLCEDPSLKEDQSRLEKCKILFSTLKSSELLPLVPEILAFLNDRWSVIRVECGKQLAKLPGSFSEDLVAILIGGCSSSSTWQEIHGSILGLNGLVASAESRKHASLLANISSLCLGFIGNANIPIKEASRSCLISIQRRISDKATLVHQIIGRVDIVVRQSDSDTEANSLILDGLLSCLVDNYQMFPELVRTASSSAGAVSSVAIVQTLRCCALHPASTVRQRAGQILTLFLLSFFKDDNENDVGVVDEVPQLVLVITELLRDALQTGREEDCWCLQEISLMVAEELVRVITEQKLDMLNAMCGAPRAMVESTTASAAVGSAALLDHALGFLAFLKNHLHLLLAHSQFEVRRMAVQLTPQLARVYVLMNVPVLVPAGEGDGGARTAAIDLSMHVEARRGETAVQEKDEVEREGLHVISEESLEHSNAGEDNSGDREHGNRYSLTSVDSSDIGGVCNQGAAAASGSLNRRRDFGLRVLLNAGLNAQRNDSGVPRLDLPLIAEMVWVSEVVKENQHLFEAYGLSEQWKTSSATSELQMRTSSVKDSFDGRNGRCSMSRHSEYDEEEGSSFSEDGCARSVVDHWSLDVRGRLQEIEKRTQFHRSVKSIVAASLDSGSTAVVALLASNCQAILTMADHLLTTWEQVFRSETDSAAFTSTLLTFNSGLDSHLVEGGPTVLTVDMLECCALLESFFLSVQYRLVQCPDIANSSCPALEEAAFLVSAAECQHQRLLRLSTHWLQHLAQIQCISRCSTHISSRSAITGHSTQRPSASELLLVALATPTDKRIQQDLFSSTDSDFVAGGCDTLGNSVRSCSVGVLFYRTLTSVRAQMSTASGKDASPRHGEYPVEDVFADMQCDRVLLTSSLTNAAASIHSVSFAPSAGSAVSAAADLTYLQTPSHALSHSVHSTPHTSLHHNRASLTPSGFTFSSPPVPTSQAGATPSGHSSSSSSGPLIHRYQAMDQWNCEAVSPLLTCIAGAATSDPRRCIQLAALVVEWVAACVMHPLWLDCRHNARKNLFESLAQLLVGAEHSATLISVEDSALCLLLLRIVRAIAEVLTLRSAKPLLELKTLLCLVKAAAAGVRLFEHYFAALRGHCSDPTGRLNVIDDDNTVLLQAFRDVYAFSMQGLMQETAKRIYLGVEYYKTVFPLPEPSAPADTLRGKLSSPPRSHGRDPMSPARRSQSSELLPVAGQEEGPGEDEFSDWDEDSESDEGPACLSDSSAAATATQGLLRMLWEEADGLSCLVAPWEQYCAAI